VPRNPPTAAGQVLRRFTLGSGPLKRGSDRLEFLARVLLVCSLLAATPISLAAATATYTQARDQAATEAVDRHRVPARLLDDVPWPAGEVWDKEVKAQGIAVWTDPAGTERRVTVSVRAGARAGHTVYVWMDRDGNRTPPPMRAGDVTGRAVGQALGIFSVLSLIACGAYLWVRTLLDRSRFRRWAAGWASVEPVWTRLVS
jgi:hypothetical protein